MKVRITGPNLNDQSKGTFHVHADGCADLKKYGPGRKFGGEVNGEDEMLVDVASPVEVVEAVYADALNESPGTKPIDWLYDFHFAPCCDSLAREAVAPARTRKPKPPLKRASYRAGIEWIALNDEPEEFDVDTVAAYISTGLLADLFGQPVEDVAEAIVRYRSR